MQQPGQQRPAPGPANRDVVNDWALRLEGAHEEVKPGAARRTAQLAAVLGLAFVALYAISFFLLEATPLGRASGPELVDYYADGKNLTLTLAAMVLMPFAGIAFIWFMVALRAAAAATGRPVSRLVGHVHQATGIAFVALLFVATAAFIATPTVIDFAGAEPDPAVARVLPLLGGTVLLFFAMRMAAMFVFTSSSIGLATGLLPKWFAYLGYVVGLALLLAFSVAAWFVLLFAAWVAVLCILMLWRGLAPSPAG